MVIHEIKSVYKQFPQCKKINCLCGETYTQHDVKTIECCPNCLVPLKFDKYVVELYDKDDLDNTYGIAYCPKCEGVSLLGYSDEEKESVLNTLNRGINKIVLKYR